MENTEKNILVFLPCHNEAENCLDTLNELREEKEKIDRDYPVHFEILIIDDGSTDDTAEMLDNNHHICEYSVLNLPQNRGYGFVLQTGFEYAQKHNFDYAISFDFDGQHDSRFLSKMVSFIFEAHDQYDIISGTRYSDPQLFWQNPWKDRFLVNAVITGVLNSNGFSFTDAFCGFKAYKVASLSQLSITVDGYEMAIELLMETQKHNFQIIEMPVPVIYKDRDEICKKRTSESESFLFKAGEERIAKYVKIMSDYMDNHLDHEIPYFQDIFRAFFGIVPEITRTNFARIQQQIFHEIHALTCRIKDCNDPLHIKHTRCNHDADAETRCTCCESIINIKCQSAF
ncbi:MAG: glycosyltransferase family 2 protein [Promethearchaeota archaeon]